MTRLNTFKVKGYLGRMQTTKTTEIKASRPIDTWKGKEGKMSCLEAVVITNLLVFAFGFSVGGFCVWVIRF